MKLLFMGPPGAGKGTQANIICDLYGIPQISTGEILRAAVKAGTQMGIKAHEFMNAGKLVPDEVVIGIVKDRIAQPDAAKGYVLDGFPRTIEQAKALDEILAQMNQGLDAALNLSVKDDELIKRLNTYNKQTLPLIDYYKNKGLLKEIDGLGEMTEITSRMKKILETLGK